LDPILDEEFAMDARLTVNVADKTIHAMQKGGSGAFSPDEISGLVDRAMSQYKGVRKLIK
jgi:exosome complex RNA-binding protein Rrp42 (RNase PH superfamily)